MAMTAKDTVSTAQCIMLAGATAAGFGVGLLSGSAFREKLGMFCLAGGVGGVISAVFLDAKKKKKATLEVPSHVQSHLRLLLSTSARVRERENRGHRKGV